MSIDFTRGLLAAAGGASAPRDQNFNQVVLALHGDGTNGAQNNTFIDSSANNFAITRNGNVTQGPFSPYGDRWSNYFGGSGDYLETPNNVAFDFAAGDFTVECFAYFNSVSGSQAFFARFRVNQYGFVFQYDPAVGLNFIYSTTGTSAGNVSRTYSATLSVGQWYHIAFARSGGLTRAFVNGIQVGSTTSDNVNIFNSNQPQVVGIIRDDALFSPFNGYISNLRVVKGTALYTSNFTPSTTPLTAVAGTSLLTCQSNRFIDNSTNNFTITRNGDVSVQRFSPFAPSAAYSAAVMGGSGYFDGNGDYLSVGTTSSFNFLHNATALFTIEAWIYCSSFAAYIVLFDTTSAGSANVGVFAGISTAGQLRLLIGKGSAGNAVIDATSSGTVPLNQWSHVAITYDQSLASANCGFYINGVAAGTASKTANAPSSGNASFTGQINSGNGNGVGGAAYFGGFRIANAVVYTTNFTPPTAPLTSVTNTQLLLNFTNAGIVDNAMQCNIETVGNAQISTTVTKYGTGSLAFDGNGDWLIAPSSPNFSFGTGNFTIEGWVYFSSVGSTQFIAQSGTDVNNRWVIYFTAASGLVFDVASASALTVTCSQGSSSGWATGTWYHLAVVRNGTAFSIYRNGSSIASATDSDSVGNNNGPMYVGGSPFSGETALGINGYIDDLRITKGVARYTANFTPPALAFADQ